MDLTSRIHGELVFWLRLMKEHAFFLELSFPPSRENLIKRAQNFVLTFAELQTKAQRIQNPHLLQKLILETRSATRELLGFKQQVLNLIIQCQLRLASFALFADHLVREAEAFLQLLEEWEYNLHKELLGKITDTEKFWTRIMTDHAKFIKHLLDPSQHSLVETANRWSKRFDNLYRQADDYDSMVKANPECFPALNSFTAELIEETQGIAAFKRSGRDKLLNCQALATTIPLIMDHMMRETEHFLGELVTIEGTLVRENRCQIPPTNPLPPNTPPFA